MGTETDDIEIELCACCEEPLEGCSCQKCEHCEENVDAGDCDCPTCESCGDKFDGGDYECTCEDCCSFCYSSLDYCSCCRHCHLSDCECATRQGHSSVPPWEQRGIYHSKAPSTPVHIAWPELENENIDPCQVAASFYLLEGISNGLPYLDGSGQLPLASKTAKSAHEFIEKYGRELFDETVLQSQQSPDSDVRLRSIALEANMLLDDIVDEVIGTFWSYVHIAISGEVRHHQAIGGEVLSVSRNGAWGGWRSVYDKVGVESIKDLATLFREFDDGSYGGPPWAEAAEILYSYEKGILGPNESMNKRMFLDRIFTMVHNSGSLLDKVQWASKTSLLLSQMNVILDSHANDDPDWGCLFDNSRLNVKKLMYKWYAACSDRDEKAAYVSPPDLKAVKVSVCCYCFFPTEKGHLLGCANKHVAEADRKFEEIQKGKVRKVKGKPFYDSNFNPVNDRVVFQPESKPWFAGITGHNTIADTGKFEVSKQIFGDLERETFNLTMNYMVSKSTKFETSIAGGSIVLNMRKAGETHEYWFNDSAGTKRFIKEGTTVTTQAIIRAWAYQEEYV